MLHAFRKAFKTSPLLALTFIFSFLLCPFVAAQEVDLKLPPPSKIKPVSKPFQPLVLKAITVNPQDPFLFDFLIDKGDSKLEGAALDAETQKLVKYFLAALTIPESDLWVNLSPYEQDSMVPQVLGITELGKDLLSDDYILKQVAAGMTNPNTEIGEKFWQTAYARAKEQFGTTEVPINTFSKVWIVPENAVVLEQDGSAFVADSYLKVFLDEDYLAVRNNLGNKQIGTDKLADAKTQAINKLSAEVMKEIVLPEIEKEVNTGKNFERVRQIYNSAILATWYKQRLKESVLGQLYADKGKVAGVNADDMEVGEKIFDKYAAALKAGAYSIIKQDYDLSTQKILQRKYFSGGVRLASSAALKIQPLASARITGAGTGGSSSSPVSNLTPRAQASLNNAIAAIGARVSGATATGGAVASSPTQYIKASVRVAQASAPIVREVNERRSGGTVSASTALAEVVQSLNQSVRPTAVEREAVVAMSQMPAISGEDLKISRTEMPQIYDAYKKVRDVVRSNPQLAQNPARLIQEVPEAITVFRTNPEVANRFAERSTDGTSEIAAIAPQIVANPRQIIEVKSALRTFAAMSAPDRQLVLRDSGLDQEMQTAIMREAPTLDTARTARDFNLSTMQRTAPVTFTSLTQNSGLVAKINQASSSLVRPTDMTPGIRLAAVSGLRTLSTQQISNTLQQNNIPQDQANKIAGAIESLRNDRTIPVSTFGNPSELISAAMKKDATIDANALLTSFRPDVMRGIADVHAAVTQQSQSTLIAMSYADRPTLTQAYQTAGYAPAEAETLADRTVALRSEAPTAFANNNTFSAQSGSEMNEALSRVASDSRNQDVFRSYTPVSPFSDDTEAAQWRAVTVVAPSSEAAALIEQQSRTLLNKSAEDAKRLARDFSALRQRPQNLRSQDAIRTAPNLEDAEDLSATLKTLGDSGTFKPLAEKYVPPSSAYTQSDVVVLADMMLAPLSWSQQKNLAATVRLRENQDLRTALVAEITRSRARPAELRDPKLSAKSYPVLTALAKEDEVRTVLNALTGNTRASTATTTFEPVLKSMEGLEAPAVAARLRDVVSRGASEDRVGELATGMVRLARSYEAGDRSLASLTEQQVRTKLIETGTPPEAAALYDKSLGGIDLSAERMGLKIKVDGNGVVIPVSRQDLENIKIEGLAPVVLDVQPATIQNTPFLMNLSGASK